MRRGSYVAVAGWPGIAFYVRQLRPNNRVDVVMVGDDRVHNVRRVACASLPKRSFCGVCGQIGCRCDGLAR